jgi:RND family efflux transporter MFP subunit
MRVSLRGLITLLCLAGFLVSCGKKEPQEIQRQAGAVREVRTAAASMRTMSRSVFVVGTLAPQERSTLSAKVPGRLEELRVDIGSSIEQGMLLAQIERKDYELRLAQAAAALAQARAALGLSSDGSNDKVKIEEVPSVQQAAAVLDEATKNRQRVQDLVKSGIAPQSESDTAESVFRVAQARHESALQEARTRMAALAERRADYNLAQKQLDDTRLIAPYAGAVQDRRAGLGEYLAPGAPILDIVKSDVLRLRLEVPERSSMLVRTGQQVFVTVEGDTNRHAGVVTRLSPALNEQTRMLVIEADVPARGALRPGLFARAEVITGSDDQLAVPQDALVTFAGVQKVVAVESGKAVEKTVSTGRSGPGWIEVTAGLKTGELVVLNPAGLRTGQPVRLVGQPAPSTPETQPLTALDAKAR